MTAPPPTPRRILPALVLAQLAGTSPWFAVNAVMPDLQREFGWAASELAWLTSAIQLGFIAGSLVFAMLALADRFSARRVFMLCSLASAACCVLAVAVASSLPALLLSRAVGGFFLAGIYPVGMKLAALWFPRGLGGALGWLVGALVLGSASSHGLRAAGAAWPWHSVFYGVALASLLGGLLVLWAVPEPLLHIAPVRPHPLRALGLIARDPKLRASVLGYFGHMWELYTVWVLVPLILAARLAGAGLSWAAFAVLGAGALGCVLGGYAARRFGSAWVAGVQLAVSGLCCLAAPWAINAPDAWFGLWLLLWGTTVAGDSPQFSALTATNAPRDAVGSVLTLTNALGFAISVLSIQLFVALSHSVPLGQLLPWLGLGPMLGVWALRPLLRRAYTAPNGRPMP